MAWWWRLSIYLLDGNLFNAGIERGFHRCHRHSSHQLVIQGARATSRKGATEDEDGEQQEQPTTKHDKSIKRMMT
jgi:hypothetical protein